MIHNTSVAGVQQTSVRLLIILNLVTETLLYTIVLTSYSSVQSSHAFTSFSPTEPVISFTSANAPENLWVLNFGAAAHARCLKKIFLTTRRHPCARFARRVMPIGPQNIGFALRRWPGT
jgi:hypothetical protein